jgi:hypothetical protein
MTEQQMALPGLTNVFIFEETPLRPAWSKDELRSTREKIRNAFESHDTASEAFSCRGFLNWKEHLLALTCNKNNRLHTLHPNKEEELGK